WLADHVVGGVVVVPGTALVELAVRAGDEVGASRVRELTVAAPLVLPASGGVRVQVRVGAADASGVRSVTVHSQPEEDADPEWVRHAEGVLEPVSAEEPVLGEWPPAGASEVDLGGWYPAVADRGLVYGPVFQGLRRAWASGGEVFAEVALPDEVVGEAAAFGVHPALLDAALHPVGLLLAGEAGGPRVPFVFEGVQVHASGASVLRVRLTRVGSGVRLVAVDSSGAAVVSVDSLVLREMTGVVAPGAAARSLFEVAWLVEEVVSVGDVAGWALLVASTGQSDSVGGGGVAGLAGELAARGGLVSYPDVVAVVVAVASGSAVPPALVLPVSAVPGAAVPDTVRDVTSAVLATVRSWLAAETLAESRLVVVTRGAVVARDGDVVTDLAGAAVWG
ncbi:polyketide synthase dehydratase domain-containing protein, partial [Micromonospora rubida]